MSADGWRVVAGLGVAPRLGTDATGGRGMLFLKRSIPDVARRLERKGT
jgi:hypothetical protein